MSEYARRMRRRLDALSWWRSVARDHPGGVVPIPTAARILGVQRRRVAELVAEGRLRVVDGMPGGSSRDRFVPVDDLIGAPFREERGRAGVYGPDNRKKLSAGKRPAER